MNQRIIRTANKSAKLMGETEHKTGKESMQGELDAMNTKEKHLLKNRLIRQLWLVLREISGADMADEDLNLWTEVTNHLAIQNRLNPKPERKP